MPRKPKNKAEFGDFQTPLELAGKVCALLKRQGICPASILEPTCGQGTFLLAGLETFSGLKMAVGVEINTHYVGQAQEKILKQYSAAKIDILNGNFFNMDWQGLLKRLPDPLLIIGNPPWVTNSALSLLESDNLPKKKNEDKLSGMDALTGKSNFDISEWMIRRNLEWLDDRSGYIAVLCKTSVARKVLYHAWRRKAPLAKADLFHIDASMWFDASVDACLLVLETKPGAISAECNDYESLCSETPGNVFALRNSHLLSNLQLYEKWAHLEANSVKTWRSGIKHDCSRVFELMREGKKYRNGLGEIVDLEPDLLYPMLKGSELAREKAIQPKRWMLVPQKKIGEDTKCLRTLAPKTWRYLEDHAFLLDNRRSGIYKNNPSYSIFGVGDYSFTPWKVAICGLYKKLFFKKIGPCENKPVVLDDTCYFFPCSTEDGAEELAQLLNSDEAKEFYSAFIFWDAKRPITAQILNKLNLSILASVLNHDPAISFNTLKQRNNKQTADAKQKYLFPVCRNIVR